MQTAKNWFNDLPQQFHDKHNIEVLITAFSRQLDELLQVFDDLDRKTDIDTAVRTNLDGVGNILCMSRKDATEIVREAMTYEMSDDLYRQVLRYQKMKQTCECTYEDIMGAISLLWDTNNIKYTEDPERPATVLLELPDTSVESMDPATGRILSIKSAGVAVYYTVNYLVQVCFNALEKVTFPNLTLKYEFPFWKILYLDGTWLLDGEYKLTGFTVPMDVEIGIGGISAQIEETVDFPKMTVRTTENIDETIKSPSMRLLASLKMGEEMNVKAEVSCIIPAGDEEEISGEVILAKNLWYLNGDYLLDGSKLLNASLKKEVL